MLERRAGTVPVETHGAATERPGAGIRTDERGRDGVSSGHGAQALGYQPGWCAATPSCQSRKAWMSARSESDCCLVLPTP